MVLNGEILSAKFYYDEEFGFKVPTALNGIDPNLFFPEKTWHDRNAYAKTRKFLLNSFEENFKKKFGNINLEKITEDTIPHLHFSSNLRGSTGVPESHSDDSKK